MQDEGGSSDHSGTKDTHRPHIRKRSRSSAEIASSQNSYISSGRRPARRIAFVT
jgi:hypothetical protein